MSIGILTFHRPSNYGAVLQGYAMQRVLRDQFELDSEFIDYRCAAVEAPFKWSWRRCGVIANNYVNARLNPLFSTFRDKYCETSIESYQASESIAKHASNYGAVVFGSDQIWNPTIFGGHFDSVFFGQGFPESTKKIAYAASFGGNGCVAEDHFSELKSNLNCFSAISVREEDGADLLERIVGDRPRSVLDPTLLVDDYSGLMEPVSGIGEDYILLFGIQFSPELKGVCEQISKATGRQIVVPLTTQTGLAFGVNGKKIIVSPGQWLWLIKNASLVVTNSFHTCVFSVLFETPFIAIALQRKMATRNERMCALLATLGLDSRFISSFEPSIIQSVSNAEINWSVVRSRLSVERAASLDFLSGALA